MIVICPFRSSQTRNRTYARAPLTRSERNASAGARLLGVVVVVVVVVVVTTVVVPPTAATTLDGAEATVVLPDDVRAVTSARIRCPTSARRTPYVWPVAPGMFTQPGPSLSQRCHWRPYEFGVGDQLPFVTRSVPPITAEPARAGRTVFAGPWAESTGAVGLDVAAARP